MSARLVSLVAVMGILFAVLTAIFGWGAVPVVALVLGAAAPRLRLRTGWIGVGAVLGWGAILGWQSAQGGLATLLGVLGAALGIPGVVPLLLTLLLAFLLAWPAALLSSELVRLIAYHLGGGAAQVVVGAAPNHPRTTPANDD